MITFKPIQLALWLFVGCISFGLALGWGWLLLLGLFSPMLVGCGFILVSLLRRN